jgi:sensor histidine kinase YesM
MNELSLHILDIVQNSIKANAKLVEIIINEQDAKDKYTITIIDDGHGMDAKTLTEVSDPFFTTRTTRKVGMGTSLFKMAAELCEGSFAIESTVNVGTTVTASFVKSHIDRAPLGAIDETIVILMLNDSDIDIYYKHIVNSNEYIFDTREIRQVLDGIPFTDYSVIEWVKNNIKDGINTIIEEEQT